MSDQDDLSQMEQKEREILMADHSGFIRGHIYEIQEEICEIEEYQASLDSIIISMECEIYLLREELETLLEKGGA